MYGWLIVNGYLHNEKFDELTALFEQAADNCEVSLQTIPNCELLVDTAITDFEEKPDFAVFWDKDILLAEYLEGMGIRLYNPGHCIAVCDDKRKTHLALQRASLPMPETVFAPMTYPVIGFKNLKFLDSVEQKLSYPMVVKEAYGSFGEQVYLAENRKQLESLLGKCQTAELIFQQYIEESRGRDIRLQVVGNHVIGSMYRHSDTDFRANVTAGGQMENYRPTKEECQLAIRAAKAVGADFAGVDLLFGKEGPLVCEVNSNAHFKNLMDCSGINTAEHILKYICEEIR